jgi:hypothetical protein
MVSIEAAMSGDNSCRQLCRDESFLQRPGDRRVNIEGRARPADRKARLQL